MYCPKCGYRCGEEARFCPMCGTPQPRPIGNPVAPEAVEPESTPEAPAALICPEPEEQIPAQAEERMLPEAENQSQSEGEASAEETKDSDETVPECLEQMPPEVPMSTDPAGDAPVQKPQKGRHLPAILVMAGMLVLGLVLFFAIPWGNGTAASASDPWFLIEDGTLTFVDSAYPGETELTVPDTVAGQTVRELGVECFAKTELTTVILPGGLERISARSFYDCSALRGLYLPEGVVQIGQEAFYGCDELEAICIPSTVEQIGTNAFSGCYQLRYIFYSGTYASWENLYTDYISPFTYVICEDGVYRQGGAPSN